MAKKLTHKEYLTLRNTARILRSIGTLAAEQLKRLEGYEAAVAEYERENKQEYFCPGCGYAGAIVHEAHAAVFDVLYAIEDDHRAKSSYCSQKVVDIRVRNAEMCSDEEWAQFIGGKAC